MMPGRIRKFFWYLEIVPKLGIWNVLYVLYYRMLLKSGFLQSKFPVNSTLVKGLVFSKCATVPDFPIDWEEKLLKQADRVISGTLPYYSHHWMEQSTPPDWFLNPFNGKECKAYNSHWTQIPDFNKELGDIKNVWEASRFSWLGILARAYAVSGKIIYLDTLNDWISDWIVKNPVNQGPNWKCGQEASYRVFSLLNAANILDQAEQPSELLMTMISLHLRRISSNTRYARTQRNNHATSEAAALFIGGNWLLKVNAPGQQQIRVYVKKGREALEFLVGSLTYEDGSFSQHSVVYHRLFLDTLNSVVFWTKKLGLQEFTPGFYEHAQKALNWLFAMCDESGNCPNLGSNDGTLLQSNHSCDYRDFRPSLQLASVLLEDQVLFGEGPYNEVLYWSGCRSNHQHPKPFIKPSRVFKSGYVVMNNKDSWAMLRLPFYKFRPAHNDTFHFDLWANGRNLLIDSGSYSYNPEKECKVPDLKSVHSHNTLSFDQKEQMPRLGRFLLARWLKPLSVGEIVQLSDGSRSWEGSYIDAAGNFHLRRIKWNNKHWEIVDQFKGGAENVEIGFNFDDCKYTFDTNANALILPWGKLTVSKNAEITVRSHTVSQYYFQSSSCFRFIISSKNNSEVTTFINIS